MHCFKKALTLRVNGYLKTCCASIKLGSSDVRKRWHGYQSVYSHDVNAAMTSHLALQVSGLCTHSLPPANEVCEGYVFTRVCHSVHRGVCPIACWDASLGPEADRPPPLDQRQPPGSEADPPGPEAGTPPRDQRQIPPGAVHAGRYGQQAGGTHPTGMHSCCDYFYTTKNRLPCGPTFTG